MESKRGAIKKFPALSIKIRGHLETNGFKVLSVRRKSAVSILITLKAQEGNNRKALKQSAFDSALEVVRQYEGNKPKIDIEVVE